MRLRWSAGLRHLRGDPDGGGQDGEDDGAEERAVGELRDAFVFLVDVARVGVFTLG